MVEPFYRMGELRGPFAVISDKFECLPNGRTLETVIDSGGNSAVIYGWNDDREYYPVCQRDGSILVPFTVKHRSTMKGVPIHASWVYVGNSKYDYWRVLCDWWVPRDFTVIEHDVRATPEVFEEFAICPEPWCHFRYDNHTDEDAEAWKYGILGCTRFRQELIQGLPTAVKDIEWRYRDWHHMSTGLGIILREAGFDPHLHGVIDHHRMMDVGGVATAMEAA